MCTHIQTRLHMHTHTHARAHALPPLAQFNALIFCSIDYITSTRDRGDSWGWTSQAEASSPHADVKPPAEHKDDLADRAGQGRGRQRLVIEIPLTLLLRSHYHSVTEKMVTVITDCQPG